MRTSGKGSDLFVVAVPVLLLVLAGVALAGDSRRLFASIERSLWRAVYQVGAWVASLFA
jgi:hypothetical protein